MKKLLFVAALLAMLVGGAFAQEWTTETITPARDSVFLTVSIKMVGLSFSVDGIAGSGLHQDAGLGDVAYALVGDTLIAGTHTYAGTVLGAHPCDTAQATYIIENTGGITADFMLTPWNRDVAATPWTYASSATFACGAEGIYSEAYSAFGGATFVADILTQDGLPNFKPITTAAGTNLEIRKGVTATPVDMHLVAEDPTNIGDFAVDGVYSDGELDCMDFMWFVRIPSSSAEATMNHIIVITVRGIVAS